MRKLRVMRDRLKLRVRLLARRIGLKPWTEWGWVNKLAKRTDVWVSLNEHSREQGRRSSELVQRIEELKAIEQVFQKAKLQKTEMYLTGRGGPARFITISHAVSEELFFSSRMYGGNDKAFDWLAKDIALRIVHDLRRGFIPEAI